MELGGLPPPEIYGRPAAAFFASFDVFGFFGSEPAEFLTEISMVSSTIWEDIIDRNEAGIPPAKSEQT